MESVIKMIKMKLFNRKSSRSSNGSRLNDSGGRGSESENGSISSAIGPVAIQVYNESRDTAKEMFDESETCEDICLTLAKQLNITPTMLSCFGLGVFDTSLNKYYWLAPREKPSEIYCNLGQAKENDVYFRMRFLPEQTKCIQVDEINPKCLGYLTWQVKWDFLHNYLQCFTDDSKTDEARGVSCILILLKLRMNTDRENCQENLVTFMKGQDLNQFLPVYLKRKWIEKMILKHNMMKILKNLQKTHPADQCNPHYLMKWCLSIILKQNHAYYTEIYVAYDLTLDTEEFERIEEDDQPSQIIDRSELKVSVKMDKSYPRLIVAKKDVRNDNMINCYVENISKLEISSITLDNETWWRIQLFRQDGHPEMLYFKERNEAYSFATCLECYSRLIYDFYDTLCQELEPTRVRELNRIRAHGPVRDEYVRKKLLKKNSKDLYILRANLYVHCKFDVLYLPSITSRLKKQTLPKIKQVEDGYIEEGKDMPPQDLKVLMNDLVRKTNILPGTCQRIKPQSEGCDLLQSLIMGQEPRDLQGEDEERREKKRIENQPKFYSRTDLVTQSLLGHGHFTEVYNGLLCEQDQVVVKKMRIKDIEDDDFSIVQEAFLEGLEKLMALGDPQYFVGYMGMTLTPNVCMIMKGSSYGSLRRFLQYREEGLPMLSLHHLLDANIQLASALVYMEERNCYHGNIHCDNISVMNYDQRTMVIRICDPGLVSLYNKLPLNHPVNKKRLPWCAPELHANLSAVTAQSEVYAYGTTVWQMFSQGLNPVDHDQKLKNKSTDQILSFFADGNVLTCPQFLLQKNEDPTEIKEVKDLLYRVMTLCWNKDAQGRADPKRVLRELNSNVQTYEETYHKYNVIPYFDVVSSAATLYPAASASTEGTGPLSSGFINSDQPVQVPDLSCLRSDGQRNGESSPRRNENRAQSENVREANRSEISTAFLRPVGTQVANTQAPLHLGQPRGANGTTPSRQLGMLAATSRGNAVLNGRKLEVDWNADIGKGHYGAVYKGKIYPKDELRDLNPHAGPETVVVKVLKPEMAEKYCEDFKKEAQVMQKLRHPNVVKFYGICHEGEYLVMEFVENNSLHKYVASRKESQSITPLTFLQLSADIATGMEYLESQRVIHCDLAARNVLLTGDVRAKISDFGLSKVLSQEKDYYRRTQDKTIPIFWCAPEWIGFKRFTSKSDVWSYGVVLWEMYSYGKYPVIVNDANPRSIFDTLSQGRRLSKPRNCPDKVYDEMYNCWKQEENNRPDFLQLRLRFEQLCSEARNVQNGVALPTSSLTEIYSRSQTQDIQVRQAISNGVMNRNEPLHPSKETGKNKDDATNSLLKQTSKEMPTGAKQSSGKESRFVNGNIEPLHTSIETGKNNDDATNSLLKQTTKEMPTGTQQSSGKESRFVNGNIEPLHTSIETGKNNDDATNSLLKQTTKEMPTGAQQSSGKESRFVNGNIEPLHTSIETGKNNDDATNSLLKQTTKEMPTGAQQSSGKESRFVNGNIEPLHTSIETGKNNDDATNSLLKQTTKEMPTGTQQSSGKENRFANENIIINKEDLTFDSRNVLGAGAFGKVYKGIYHGETVAVKKCTEPKEYERFSREFHLLYKLKDKSTNIVKFIGLYEQRDTGVGKQHMYVMEYLEGGSLHSFLVDHKKAGNNVDILTKIRFLTDVAKGMNCLFQSSIVHGDLTAKNILLSKDLTAKISDFGLAKQLESSEDNIQYLRKDPAFQPQWAAPEVFQGKVYTKFTDIWSFGVVCIEVFQDGTAPSLPLPLSALKQTKDAYLQKFYSAILRGARFPKPPQCPEKIYDGLILKCWEKEYKKRMHYNDIIEALSSYTPDDIEQNQ